MNLKWSSAGYLIVCIRCFHCFWDIRFIHIPWTKGDQEKNGTWKIQLKMDPASFARLF
uniref:Uncharacterized protein n=1 Tax=Aquilaria malaccensis TaxID=223753 RepID=A0A4Y6GML1_9ROSI|nr:hypothetical protein [Aquilaria malaccensis]